MDRPGAPYVLVDLHVLIAPADERSVAEAVRSSVSSVPGVRAAGEPRWRDARDHGLVRQWAVEQRAPVGERRVRRITADVEVVGAAPGDLVGEVAWAAIDAVCPTAREERRRLDAGVPVEPAADEVPWSSATRVVVDGDDRPAR